MALRRLVPEPFHIDPHLLGQPLASPLRRLAAFALDGLILIVPTLAVGLAAAAVSLYVADRAGFDALLNISRLGDKDAAVAQAEAAALAPLLVRLEAPGLPPAVTLAVEEGRPGEAAAILRASNIVFSLKFEEGQHEALPPGSIRFPVERLIPAPIRALALLAVPALYFAAFSRSRRGATPGKRLVGIRVVRLDGERLGWLEALERFVGYIHIPATAFLSLLDFWRDPNRRLPHDRTVHTAVFRNVARAGTAATESSSRPE